ncbi:hypothetical protein Droror1_Dr00027110 [Drosera rotundifolia]
MGNSSGSKKRGKSRGRSASRSRDRDMSQVQCYYCKDFGHMKLQCPKLSEKKKNGKGKAPEDKNDKQGNVAVAECSGSDDSDADLMIATQSSDVIQCRVGFATPSIANSSAIWVLIVFFIEGSFGCKDSDLYSEASEIIVITRSFGLSVRMDWFFPVRIAVLTECLSSTVPVLLWMILF